METDLLVKDSHDIFSPLIDAMVLEGSYNIKEPCYDKNLVNPYVKTCLHGSKWSEQAQFLMAGNITDKNAAITTDDNFHRVYTVDPVHLP